MIQQGWLFSESISYYRDRVISWYSRLSLVGNFSRMKVLLMNETSRMKRHIPNTLTSLNLFTGCIGVVFVFQGSFDIAFYTLIICGVFDFLDGTAARLLNVRSSIGKELDSLADMVSFGLLPGAVVYMMLRYESSSAYLPYLGFLITVFSALRLAKFNIDDRQTTDFIGVNTPMNSFLVISLSSIWMAFREVFPWEWFLVVFTLISSYLLVSEIRLFSAKLTDTSWVNNKYKYIFLGVSLLLLLLLREFGIPLVFVAYLAFSWLHFNRSPNDAR